MELANLKTVATMPFVMTHSELREFRERLGLSQEQLAEKLKVARNTVSRWENESRKIPEFLELALKTIERELKEQA